MRTLEGEELTASYSEAEWAEMSRLRVAGVPDDELRLIHEVKARFDARLLEEEPKIRGVRALNAGFDERRNTSRVFAPTPADIEAARAEREARATAEAEPGQETLLG